MDFSLEPFFLFFVCPGRIFGEAPFEESLSPQTPPPMPTGVMVEGSNALHLVYFLLPRELIESLGL